MRVGMLSVVAVLTAANAVFAAEFRPVAVTTATDTYSARFDADKMIDGDLATYACFQDDTRTGKDPKADPPFAAAPVTCSFVLDLGEERETAGLKFISRNCWAATMASCVSVWACADGKGNEGLVPLAAHAALPPVVNSYPACVTWPKTRTRYLKVLVEDANRKPIKKIWCDEIMWEWARMNGDPLTGDGKWYNCQIAEVTAFDAPPAAGFDPNAADVAFPRERLERDWVYQDAGLNMAKTFSSRNDCEVERKMTAKALAGVPDGELREKLIGEFGKLSGDETPGCDPRWRDLYMRVCAERRRARLMSLRSKAVQFVYTKNHVFGGEQGLVSAYDQWDDQVKTEYGNFKGWSDSRDDSADGKALTEIGSQLCIGTINEDGTISHEVILDRPFGLIANVNLSWDGKTLVFAMRENYTNDCVSLYTMDLATRRPVRITFPENGPDGRPLAVTDTEPVWLPSGDIVFVSTRYSRICDCWYRAGGDIYTCRADGSFLRRLTNDELMSNLPQVTGDGRIVFTRWEYNDRTALYLHPLIVMNPDGTGQTEWYGNNSDFPSSIIHATPIPGSQKLLGLVAGHHAPYKGKLALIDRLEGTQAGEGIEFVAGGAPDRTAGRKRQIVKPRRFNDFRIDIFGQDGPQWVSCFAFSETDYLVSFQPEGCCFLYGPYWPRFGAYWQNADGDRELLAYDWKQCVGRVVPVMPRTLPVVRADLTRKEENDGTFYVQDVYLGPGLKGVPRGTVKKLRVMALEYRTARIGWCGNGGEYETGLNQTPISLNSGAWDVKHVLGEVDVEDDGSCLFKVPARQAVFFHLLDGEGKCVQSMRSWATLQPGEYFGCIGCHEPKRGALPPDARNVTQAMKKPAQTLKPFANGTKEHPLVKRLRTEKWYDSVDNFLGVNAARSTDPDAPTDGFSYRREIQPILDRNCVRCHDSKHPKLNLTGDVFPDDKVWRISPSYYNPKRAWTQSYVNLTAHGNPDKCQWMKWLKPRSRTMMLPPYHTGSSKSTIFEKFNGAHHGVKLSDNEKRVFACWIDMLCPFSGSFAEANTWTDEEKAIFTYFQNKRMVYAKRELDELRNGGRRAAPNPGAWRPRERWRGFNLEGKAIKGRFSGEWREEDLSMMHELGFNFARIMIDYRYWCMDDDWTRPDPEKFGPIDEVIAWGKKHSIHIQICFSFPPGIDVKTKSKKALFVDPVAQKAMAVHWGYFARRYKGIPNDELSFNLFNEPEWNATEENYAPLIEKTTAAIHAEDPTRFVVIDGLDWGRKPELSAIGMPVGQSHHAYVPMSVTSYKASWIQGSSEWAVPVWPPLPVTSPLFGSRKPAEKRMPITIFDVPACEVTLSTGVFNREVELVAEADGKRVFFKRFVPAPGDDAWEKIDERPGRTKEWGGKLKNPVRFKTPACKRLAIRMEQGDWLEVKTIRFTAAGKTAAIQIGIDWDCKSRKEARFAGFDAKPAFTLVDGIEYTGDMYLDECKNAIWKPVLDAGQFLMVGEFGVFNQTPHDVALRWMEDNLRRWKAKGLGWALWNFRGPFGILDSDRKDVKYEDFRGHKLDRKMLELLLRY